MTVDPLCWVSVEWAVQSKSEPGFHLLQYLFLELEISPNHWGGTPPRRWSLLMVVARHGLPKVFALLIAAGADVNAVRQGSNVVRVLFLGCGDEDRGPLVYDKAQILVQCPRLHPTTAADWCVSCPKETWCHKTMKLFSQHASECARWSPLRSAWVATVDLVTQRTPDDPYRAHANLPPPPFA